MEFDEIDRKIVELLQEDGRLSNAALAEAVGLTTSAVYERTKKLEKRGVIQKYVALADPELLGQEIAAFVRVTLAYPQGIDYLEAKAEFRAFCMAETAVLECHSVAGEDCFILKVRTGTTLQLEKLLERLRGETIVASTVSNIVLSTIKETTKVAVG
ncbi:MAG TPA: Lrp/AsnC family transcriptional regulator [Anaerolineae bacterium]|nr:Lrp/AsnC family transcriptional regulator [Anaerolineae bacterium]